MIEHLLGYFRTLSPVPLILQLLAITSVLCVVLYFVFLALSGAPYGILVDESNIDKASIVVAAIALAAACVIAIKQAEQIEKQAEQIDKLQMVSDQQTDHLTILNQVMDRQSTVLDKLGDTVVFRQNASLFYGGLDDGPEHFHGYTVYLPAKEESRHPGKIVKSFDSHPIMFLEKHISKEFKIVHSTEAVEEDTVPRHAIFIGSPIANYHLDMLYPKLLEGKDCELPVWFCQSTWKPLDSTCDPVDMMALEVKDSGSLIRSPSDRWYFNAYHGIDYDVELMGDSGLIARLNHQGRECLIIAGLHQYGTAIAAHALDKLLCGDSDAVKDKRQRLFTRLSEGDYKEWILIVEGKFDLSANKVSDLVTFRDGWTKVANEEWKSLDEM